MSHGENVVMCCDVSLGHGCLMRVTFHFSACIENHRVHVLCLDVIGCGMRESDITKNSFAFSHDSHWHGINSVAFHLKIQVALNSNTN